MLFYCLCSWFRNFFEIYSCLTKVYVSVSGKCVKNMSSYNLLKPLISLPSVHEKERGCPQQPLYSVPPTGWTRPEFWQTGRYNYPVEVAPTNPKGQALSGDHWLLGRVSTPLQQSNLFWCIVKLWTFEDSYSWCNPSHVAKDKSVVPVSF